VLTHPTSLPRVRLHPLRDNKFFNYLFPYCCCRDGYKNHTTRRREELEVIELPAKGKNAKGAGRKKGTNKTRGSMESSHIHKRPVLLTFMAMAALPVSSMQRSNLRLRRVLQGKRERERGTRACLRACTNPNPSPIVRSSDRTILSVPGLERFWETSRLTNYWPGSKWMLKSVIMDVPISSIHERTQVRS
jgi:hypothetical protein